MRAARRTSPALDALVQNARENEEKLERFQAIELRLIGAHTFPDLYYELTVNYRKAFDLEAVTLALVDEDHEIRRLLRDRPRLPENLLLISTAECHRRLARLGHRPVLRSYDAATDGWLLPARELASVALLPLERRGKAIGSLHLGSAEPRRFHEQKSTQFLEHLAAVVGICVENTLNVHRLQTAGVTDPLTGIHNRRFLDERLLEELARARRTASPMSFLFIDIDHFKRVNDEFGHPSGDVVLQDVAARIAANLRKADVLTRYGGEEFAVLQPATTTTEAKGVAERILASVSRQPFHTVDGEPLSLTVSIGVATLPEESAPRDLEQAAEELSRRADEAMLEAKRSGRNRIAVAPPARSV